ncbi:hypothetical protein F7R13_13945 [Burkholderia territorii]|uniref:Uncharacterized protein n=1 Tax=Burkholderia territorii TaxID=1503055 RepID=A0A6L3NHR9_9BURK|nr:hypothetical protein F7R13_13945 [Burkholderia territorii]
MRNDMAVRTATKRTGKRRQRVEKRARTALAAHARHYGIKDSKASPDLSERISTDVSARHFSGSGPTRSGPDTRSAGAADITGGPSAPIAIDPSA